MTKHTRFTELARDLSGLAAAARARGSPHDAHPDLRAFADKLAGLAVELADAAARPDGGAPGADGARRLRELDGALAAERAARTQLERADRAKDHFISVLSHDLRAPIHAVLGWAQMLRQGMLPEDARERAFVIIERNARAQLRLVEELLDVTRIASDKLTLELESVDLAGLVDGLVENLAAPVPARSIAVFADEEEDLHVVGDRVRLEQVVTNLISNALKFTQDGGVVRVTLARDDEGVELRVEDDGEGIAPEALPVIFERFRQDHAATSAGVGVGLGLYIVRQIVELHGGTVEARSDGPGRGSSFVVRLPPSEAASIPRLSSSHLLPDLGVALDGVDVLVVDDEADTLEVLEALLTQAGANVRCAASAAAAYASFDERAPDVLVSDVGLPGEDGCGLVRCLRARRPDLPAVAISGFTDRQHVDRAIAAGFDLHFAKPVEGARLVAAIAELTHDPRDLVGDREV